MFTNQQIKELQHSSTGQMLVGIDALIDVVTRTYDDKGELAVFREELRRRLQFAEDNGVKEI